MTEGNISQELGLKEIISLKNKIKKKRSKMNYSVRSTTSFIKFTKSF